MVTMMKRNKRNLHLALAILIGLLCIALPASAANNTWYVDDSGDADFTTIRDAMHDDRIMPGDTIVILPGTYRWFDVYKPHLTIQSLEGPDSVTVDCAGIEIANREDATGLILDGLTIVNSQAVLGLDNMLRHRIRSSGTVFSGIISGVKLNATNCTFENNVFVGSTSSRLISVTGVANANFINNTFTNITSTYGHITLRDTTGNCNIINNTFNDVAVTNSEYSVIYLRVTGTNNVIAGNTFDETFDGNTFGFRDADTEST